MDCPGADASVLTAGDGDMVAMPMLRAVFMGTSPFAAVILKRLLAEDSLELVAVYTQPDRPAGRGKRLSRPPVKTLAEAHDLAVEQPPDFAKTPQGDTAVRVLAAYAPDVLLVAAYGLILPQRVLDIPKLMSLNVHASLLPKYRGAAPIQRAIMQGERCTGVTIMRMEAGLDCGPILIQRAVGIGISDTSATLHEELAETGAELLSIALRRLSAGTLPEIPQEHTRATYAHKLRKDDGLLDFSWDSQKIHAHIRGVTPWPGASIMLHREGQADLAVLVGPGVFPLADGMNRAIAAHRAAMAQGNPQLIGLVEGALLLSCGGGGYAFTSLRPAGGKSMDAAAFYNGYIAGARGVHFSGRRNIAKLTC